MEVVQVLLIAFLSILVNYFLVMLWLFSKLSWMFQEPELRKEKNLENPLPSSFHNFLFLFPLALQPGEENWINQRRIICKLNKQLEDYCTNKWLARLRRFVLC